MDERPWDPPRYEHKSGMIIPRYANTGEDCGSAMHGTIRRHHSWGLLTPTSWYHNIPLNLTTYHAKILQNFKNIQLFFLVFLTWTHYFASYIQLFRSGSCFFPVFGYNRTGKMSVILTRIHTADFVCISFDYYCIQYTFWRLKMISANNVTLRIGKKALFEDVNI